MAAFERLLAHNRKARFTWAHLGSDPARQRTPELMRALLSRHPNLYSAFRLNEGGADPLLPLNFNKKRAQALPLQAMRNDSSATGFAFLS